MPSGNDKLHELLSSYLDGSLSEHEMVEVEGALQSPSTQELLDSLRENREYVAELPRSATGLSADFTDRVLAAIEQSPKLSLPPQPATVTLQRSVTLQPSVSLTASPNRLVNRLAWAATASAAAVLGAVMIWRPVDVPPDVAIVTPEVTVNTTDLVETSAPEPVDDLKYVSDIEWQMSMALVLHVAPTGLAHDDQVLQAILKNAGIRSAAPIVADDQLQETLLGSEMIVTDESVGRASVYYVRAKATEIDAALQKVWGDSENFPSAYFNLSIDGPESELMKQIAQSTGKRFTVDQAFAAPVSRLDNGKPIVELPPLKSQEVFVSKQGRQGIPMMGAPTGSGGGAMADLLIMVRLP